jgi:RNA polymerase-binding transcription factor DksA
MSQEKWEEELEHALAEATPAEVLKILSKIEGWTYNFCKTCGEYNDTCGGKRGCKCFVW